MDEEDKYYCAFLCPYDFPIIIGNQCIKNEIYKSTNLIQSVYPSTELIKELTSEVKKEGYQSTELIKVLTNKTIKEKYQSTGLENPSTEIMMIEKSPTISERSFIKETEKIITIIDLKKIIQNILANKNEEEEKKYYDIILDIIKSNFTSGNYDTSNLDNGIDEIIETALIRITFTTTQNQKNISNNISIVDLLECETLLRENHKIPKSVIYMIKIDAIQKGMKIPKVEYDLYSQLTGRKLEKLNLKECQMNNKNISLLMPVIIDENFDKLNSSSGYYNNICYQTTSNSEQI